MPEFFLNAGKGGGGSNFAIVGIFSRNPILLRLESQNSAEHDLSNSEIYYRF